MWLINTETFELKDTFGGEGIRYAILSHRWGREEVSFADMACLEKAKLKHGFKKIEAFCAVALEKGLQYGWVDTCCIDKTSSAELSEAINSMYQWYQQAAVCYAYLSDVYLDDEGGLIKSEWFKRGWTLQELLAPKLLIFFDCEWQVIGTRSYHLQEIQEATGIQPQAIIGEDDMSRFPVAERMSWASKRITTRPEDMAYCLLGIFGVNMPLLYGEGAKAFVRLQEHIMKDSNDRSIFAWTGMPGTISGLVASSPAYFEHHRGIKLHQALGPSKLTQSYKSIKRGTKIEARLWPCYDGHYIASIATQEGSSMQPAEEFLVLLCRIDCQEPARYVRVTPNRAKDSTEHNFNHTITASIDQKSILRPSVTKTIIVCPSFSDSPTNLLGSAPSPPNESHDQPTRHRFQTFFREGWDHNSLTVARARDLNSETRPRRNANDRWVHTVNFGALGTVCMYEFESCEHSQLWRHHHCPRAMVIGLDFDFRPVCVVLCDDHGRDFVERYFGRKRQSTSPTDPSFTALEGITCLETKEDIEATPGLWAFKLGLDRQIMYQPFDGDSWVVAIGPKPQGRSGEWDIAIAPSDGLTEEKWLEEHKEETFRV